MCSVKGECAVQEFIIQLFVSVMTVQHLDNSSHLSLAEFDCPWFVICFHETQIRSL